VTKLLTIKQRHILIAEEEDKITEVQKGIYETQEVAIPR
jgi:hypothetical protein